MAAAEDSRAPEIASREVEVDGEVTIELSADGAVLLELRWKPLLPPLDADPGWTCVERGAAAGAEGEPWPWDGEAQRELALLVDALRDHRRGRTARSEMRVRFWERRARDASAEAAAAWGRERLRAIVAPGRRASSRRANVPARPAPRSASRGRT